MYGTSASHECSSRQGVNGIDYLLCTGVRAGWRNISACAAAATRYLAIVVPGYESLIALAPASLHTTRFD